MNKTTGRDIQRQMKRILTLTLLMVLTSTALRAQLCIGRIKYGGGGDWYSDPTSLPNLIHYINTHTKLNVSAQPVVIEPGKPELFNQHYLYLTGHGNIKFTDDDIKRLRYFLENGGFLHADDNYGMDGAFRRELKRIFPDKELVEVPFSHPIYHSVFDFPHGLPKVHEHDGKPPQGLAIFHKGRMIVFYTYECDLGDGWEDEEVHQDPADIREAALKMGTNIFYYHLTE